MSDTQDVPRTKIFISRLEHLDSGSRARLKRSAGKELAAAGDALGLFYSLLPYGVPQYQEETYFLTATLYPPAEGTPKGNFGEHLRTAQTAKNSNCLLYTSDAADDLPCVDFGGRRIINK